MTTTWSFQYITAYLFHLKIQKHKISCKLIFYEGFNMIQLENVTTFDQLKQYLMEVISQDQVIVYSALKGAVASFVYKSGFFTTPLRAFVELDRDIVMDTIMRYLDIPQGIDVDHIIGLELTPKKGRFAYSYQATVINPKNPSDPKQLGLKIANRTIEILQKEYSVSEGMLKKYLSDNLVKDEEIDEDQDESD
jgi:hypothetical protein